MKPKVKPLPTLQKIELSLPKTETQKLEIIEASHMRVLEKRKQT